MATDPGRGLPFIRMRRVYLLVLPLALLACSRAETAADRHMAEMNDTIQGIQSDHDKSPKAGRIEADDKNAAKAASAPPVTHTAFPRVISVSRASTSHSRPRRTILASARRRCGA